MRVGLHTGDPARTDEGYVGAELHVGARICSAGHGGQVVLSEATRDALADDPPDDVALRALGAHRLKDIDEALTLLDLEIDGLDGRFPPLRTIGSRPTNLAAEQPALIGREHELAAVVALFEDARLVTLTGPGGSARPRSP